MSAVAEKTFYSCEVAGKEQCEMILWKILFSLRMYVWMCVHVYTRRPEDDFGFCYLRAICYVLWEKGL